MLVVIAGVGTVGNFILDRFTDEDAAITLIEQDAAKVEALKLVYDTRSISGDMLSHYVLRQANVAACDIFIACSNIDSVNIVACQLAKRLGAKRCVARVYSEDIFPIEIEELEKYLGVDWLVSPSRLAAFKLTSALLENDHVRIDSYFAAKMELARITVTPANNLHKKKAQKIFKNSNKLSLIAIYRNGNNLLTSQPSAAPPTILAPSDEIIIASTKNKVMTIISDLYNDQLKKKERLYIAGVSHPVISALYLLGTRIKNATLLEKDIKKAENIKNMFTELEVLHIDPADYSQLEKIKGKHNCTFICGSADDAENLTYALNAEELGFGKIVPIVHGIDKMRFFKRLSRDNNLVYHDIICPSELAAEEIFRYFDEHIKKDFNLLHGSKALAIIKEVEKDSPWVEKPLTHINDLANDMRAVGVWRNGHIYLRDEDKAFKALQINDRILITSLSGNHQQIQNLLN